MRVRGRPLFEQFEHTEYPWSTIVKIALVNLAIQSIQGPSAGPHRHTHPTRTPHAPSADWPPLSTSDEQKKWVKKTDADELHALASSATPVLTPNSVLSGRTLYLPQLAKGFFTESKICLFIQVCCCSPPHSLARLYPRQCVSELAVSG